MALVTIVILDEEGDDVDIKLFSEPPVPAGHPEDATNAQLVAMEMLGGAVEGAEKVNRVDVG